MTQSRQIKEILFELFISISKYERNISIIKKKLYSIEDSFFKNLFNILSTNNKIISLKDIKKYLKKNNYKASNKEIQLFLFFYDIDHDLGLNYNEFLLLIKNKKTNDNKNKNNIISSFNNNILFLDLLKHEINLSRTLITYLEELQNMKGFKIHKIFHILKNKNSCIRSINIYNFINEYKSDISKEEIELIFNRLDINKDKIIDFSELHAFLGFPYCDYCCPCRGCNFCGAKYCKDCLGNNSCYLYGCNHLYSNSKMICTSIQHNQSRSLKQSYTPSKNVKRIKSISSRLLNNNNKTINNSNIKIYINEHKNSSSCYQLSAPNINDIDINNNYYKFSNQQIQILKHIMYPNQFKNFLKVSGIMDVQKSEELPITKNLKLINSPERYFNPNEYTLLKESYNNNSIQNSSTNNFSNKLFSSMNNKDNQLMGNTIKRFIPKTSNLTYFYTYEDSQNIPHTRNTRNNNHNILFNKSQKNNSTIYNYQTKKYYKNPVYNSIQIKNEEDTYKSKSAIKNQRRNNSTISKNNNIQTIQNNVNNKINLFPHNINNKIQNKNKKEMKKKIETKHPRSSTQPNKNKNLKKKEKIIIHNKLSQDMKTNKNLSKKQIKKQIENLRKDLMGKRKNDKKFLDFSLIKSVNTIYL